MPKSYRPSSLARIAKGLCPNCSATPKNSRTCCQACIDKAAAKAKERYAKMRTEVLAHYGNACSQCGFDRPEGLFIRQTSGQKPQGRQNLTAKLYRDGFPAGYEIVCFDCRRPKDT